MKVYIGFSKPSGKFVPFAELIKWVEARPYDHCYTRFQEPTGQWIIFQASKEMVNIYSTSIWLQENIPIKEYEIEVTADQNNRFWEEYVLPNLGIPYSLKEDLGILWMKIFKLKNNPYADGFSAEFCSKNDANVCNFFGVKMPEQSDNIDPTKLDSILSAYSLPCNLSPTF